MSPKNISLPNHVRIKDVSGANIQHTMGNPRLRLSGDTDIAIVGMGVNLPGATNVATLWDNLMAGVNTCSEVSKHIDWDFSYIWSLELPENTCNLRPNPFVRFSRVYVVFA